MFGDVDSDSEAFRLLPRARKDVADKSEKY